MVYLNDHNSVLWEFMGGFFLGEQKDSISFLQQLDLKNKT